MRPAKLTATDISRIDRWWNVRIGTGRVRKLPVSAMRRILRVSYNTLYDAANRRNAYARVPRVR
jgi:hypothetical protein